MKQYYWLGVDLRTSAAIGSGVRRRWNTLEGARKNAIEYMRKHGDPDDFMIEIYDAYSPRYIALGEAIDAEGLNRVEGSRLMNMVWKMLKKEDAGLEDIDVEGLDVSQKSNLAKLLGEIKMV